MKSNKILLTGAGFTFNFGLPLARDIWGMIFNHPEIQKTKLVRKHMLKDESYNYEYLYSLVLNDSKFKDERNIFIKRIAYSGRNEHQFQSKNEQ